MEVIITSLDTDGEEAVKTFFLSPFNRSIKAFQVKSSTLDVARDSLSKLLQDKKGEYENDEFTFLHGFDFGDSEAHLARAAYDLFSPRLIWNIPKFEPAEVNSYTFKQSDHPYLNYIHNYEPFIRYSKEVAVEYYEAMCGEVDPSKDLLRFGESEYYKKVINMIRKLSAGNKRIAISEDYQNLITDNFEMNGLNIVRKDPDCLVLTSTRYLTLNYIKDQITFYHPRFVVIACAHRFIPTRTLGYSYMEEEIIPAILEVFSENKNIIRPAYAIQKYERKES